MKQKILYALIFLCFLAGHIAVLMALVIKSALLFYCGFILIFSPTTSPFKKIVGKLRYMHLVELGKNKKVGFEKLLKETASYASFFLEDNDFSSLDEKLRKNLIKKNKWQGLVSTESFYMNM